MEFKKYQHVERFGNMEVVIYPDKRLREQTKKVKQLEPVLEAVPGMFDIMFNNRGCGLSANQVGLSYSFFILYYGSKKIFINPKIIEITGNSVDQEGCLSLPGVIKYVSRAEKIKVKYTDIKNKKHIKYFSGMEARIIQHETDHLNGILIIDKVLDKY